MNTETRTVPVYPGLEAYRKEAEPMARYLREFRELAAWCGGEAFIMQADPHILLPSGEKVGPGHGIVKAVPRPESQEEMVMRTLRETFGPHVEFVEHRLEYPGIPCGRVARRSLSKPAKSRRPDPVRVKRKAAQRVKVAAVKALLPFDQPVVDSTAHREVRPPIVNNPPEAGYVPPEPEEVPPVELRPVGAVLVFRKGCNCKVQSRVGKEYLPRWTTEHEGSIAPVCLGCNVVWKEEVLG
jgi:hypothetical protein